MASAQSGPRLARGWASTIATRRHDGVQAICAAGPTAMTSVSIEDPQFQSAIQACAVALRRMATYELDPSLHRRKRAFGERKEFLTPAEHEELLACVDFAHQRTIEKLGSSGFRPSADGASWHAVRPMSASPDPLRDAVVRRAGNRSLS